MTSGDSETSSTAALGKDRGLRARWRNVCATAACLAGALTLFGAECSPFDPSGDALPVYNNRTDPTNNGATYVGSRACSACHTGIAASYHLYGHSHILTPIEGQPPVFPAEATNAGVPTPPDGFDWPDVAYLLGGYRKAANFIDTDGFLITNGTAGVDSQYVLDRPAIDVVAGFVPFMPEAAAPVSYDFSCFQCHTTGPVAQDPAAPLSQDNRPGILGTFSEPGVRCEACHGPGSNHLPNPQRRDLFVDSDSTLTCARCHSRTFESGSLTAILAEDGFIKPYQQFVELRASGGHSEFACTFCHNPHASTTYDRDNAIRNACTSCHSGMNMALHEGKIFRRGNYSEMLSCESCHMTFTGRLASNASADVVGEFGRMGDSRSHIFRIDTRQVDFNTFFTADGSQVALDEEGRAAITVDFVCLRCHNGIGTFAITLGTAADIALNIHFEGQ